MQNSIYIWGGGIIFCAIIAGFAPLFGNGAENNTAPIERKNDNRLPTFQSQDFDYMDNANSYEEDALDSLSVQNNCLDECMNGLFNSLIAGDGLSYEEISLMDSNPDYLVHFLRYNPEIITSAGVFMRSADIGEEGTSSYNEALDLRVMTLGRVISYLALDDVQIAANSMLNSSDIVTKRAGLMFLDHAYDRLDDDDDIGGDRARNNETRIDLTTMVNSFLHSETDPEIQLEAIEMVARYNPASMTEQMVGSLSGLSANSLDPNIRGKAMELAALSVQPDSLVLAQISNELVKPSSELHISALNALAIALRRAPKDDVAMSKRLEEYKPLLQTLIDNSKNDPEIVYRAEDLIDFYYKE